MNLPETMTGRVVKSSDCFFAIRISTKSEYSVTGSFNSRVKTQLQIRIARKMDCVEIEPALSQHHLKDCLYIRTLTGARQGYFYQQEQKCCWTHQ